jgi:hypothetical protein
VGESLQEHARRDFAQEVDRLRGFWPAHAKESAGASRGAKTHLALLFAFYIVALVLVAHAYSAG